MYSDEKFSKYIKNNKSLIVLICIGFMTGFLLKMFVIDVLHVDGKSMQPAIMDGSTIVVNKLNYGLSKPYNSALFVQWKKPCEGDVVIYFYDNKIVVKRCIATGGTKLEYSQNPFYTLHVGNKDIPLTEDQYNNMKNSHYVPEGYILAVGDNYVQSIDSRNYGFVAVNNILGKVICK